MSENGILGLLATALITGYNAAVVWLVRRSERLEQRLDDTNKNTIETLSAAARLGEKVPQMTEDLASARREADDLRRRLLELERRQ